MTQAVTLSGLGSTNALYTDSSGNVGIGTSSPSLFATRKVLDIVGPSSGNGGLIRLADNAATTVLQIFASTGSPLSSTIRTASASDLVFGTNTTERMRIDSSGNVGIGLTSPILNSVLSIAQRNSTGNGSSTLTLEHYYANNKYIKFSWYGTTIGSISQASGTFIVIDSPALAFQTGSIDRMTIDSSGNVGIGPSSSSVGLNVFKPRAVFGDGGGTTGPRCGFYTSATEAGIGIDDSVTPNGSDFLTGLDYFYINRTVSTGLTVLANSSSLSSSGISFVTGLAGTERMRIDSSGRVTMPYQPSFSAYGSGSVVATSGSESVAVMNSVIHNIGSHFSTSTYRFTAPVAGRYLFKSRLVVAVNAQTVGGSADMTWGFYVNSVVYGSTYGGGFVGYYGESTRVDIINLAAGDYVTVGIRPNNALNLTMVYNMSGFSGELLS